MEKFPIILWELRVIKWDQAELYYVDQRVLENVLQK